MAYLGHEYNFHETDILVSELAQLHFNDLNIYADHIT